MTDYLKIPEVARRLDVSEKTARRYIKAGLVPSTFVGGAYRVTEENLEEFLRAREVHPKAQARQPEWTQVPPGEGYFVEPEEGEEPDIVKLRLYVWRELQHDDALLQEVAKLLDERAKSRAGS